MLCIQLEIAMGAESPAEDKVLRMQYQLEQMNKLGLGQQTVRGYGTRLAVYARCGTETAKRIG